MNILISGFEPFGGEIINPANLAVERLPDQIDGAKLGKQIIPTVFGQSIQVVTQSMENNPPDAWIGVGQAGGRADINLERVAININDARIQDNAGIQPVDEPIHPDGPAAYFSTLPLRAMLKALHQEGIPASISNSAGTFVCNQLMYGVLARIHEKNWNTLAGFIHVPYLPEQVVGKSPVPPSMTVEMITHGLEIAVKTLILLLKQSKLS